MGELCLIGPNVGKGYYNDPDRTRQNFIQNPCNNQYHEIIYKTGDLVRYNTDDGKLYISGRADNQIKHMGYRIELEEIENALCRLDGINRAAAIHGTVRGLSRIAAVVTKSGNLAENQVINQLKEIIPDYMVPSDVFFVDELPKNANGKLDRRVLKATYLPESA